MRAWEEWSGGSVTVLAGVGKAATPWIEANERRAVGLGAWEIGKNAIDDDGTTRGEETELLRAVMEAAGSVPVIACGGAGTYTHMRDAFVETGVQALACGSLFNFGDNNPIRAKAFLSNHGLAFKLV